MRRYNVITSSEIGTFIINKNDVGVGWQLSEYGYYDPRELNAVRSMMQILRSYRKRDLIALDIGANVGVHSVLLADLVGANGKVLAFEPQRIIYYMLAGNVAINSKSNVYCYHNAVAEARQSLQIPSFDCGKSMSFGSVEFGGVQTEWIGQHPAATSTDAVEAIAIDYLGLEIADFIKIDVEGMELRALAGAQDTIDRCRPIVLVEYLKSDSAQMIAWFKARDFRIYSGVGDNYICLPAEMGITIDDLSEVN